MKLPRQVFHRYFVLFILFFGVRAHASTLDFDVAGNLTLTVSAGESAGISSTGANNLTLTTTVAMARTGAGAGFTPAGMVVSDDFIVQGVTTITIASAGGSGQFNLQYTGNPLPQFSVGAGFTAVLAFNGLSTAGRSQSYASQVILNNDITFDSTGAGANATGANITFTANLEPFTGAPRAATVTVGTSGLATFATVGRSVAPLSSFSVSGQNVTLNGDIQTDAGGVVSFAGVTSAITFAGLNRIIDTDVAGGATNASNINFGTAPVDGDSNTNLLIDASADGGGSAGVVSVQNLGLSINFQNIDVRANSFTLSGGANTSSNQTYHVNTFELGGTLSNTTGGGTLSIDTLNPALDIGLGTGATGSLILDDAEVLRLQSAILQWNTIFIGSATGTGTVRAVGTVPFVDPITIRSQGTGGAVNLTGSSIITSDNATITLLTSTGDIATGALSTTGTGRLILVQSTSGGIVTNGPLSTTGSAAGTITLTSTNGPVEVGTAVTTQGAQISFNGRGTAVAGREVGVYLNGAAAQVNANGANVSMTGTGGTGGANNDHGVRFNGSTGVQTAGAGTLTINGTSGTTGTGVQFNGGTVTTVNGSLTVTGNNAAAAANAYGIQTVQAMPFLITSTAGLITLNGVGSPNGTMETAGVRLAGNSGSEVRTVSGNISITGTGGAGQGGDGIVVTLGAAVTTASGIITLNGSTTTGTTNSDGVEISSDSVVEATGSGTVNITGTANAAGGRGVAVAAGTSSAARTTSGPLNITGTGFANQSIVLETGGTLGGPTQAGLVTLTADGIDFNGTSVVQGTGTLTLQPLTVSGAINVGTGSAVALDVSLADIARISDGFASILIGRADSSGTVTINTPTFTDPVTIRSPNSATTYLINGITGTGNASITFNAPAINLAGNVVTANQNVTFVGATTTPTNRTINAGTGTITTNLLTLGLNVLTATGNFNFASGGLAVTVNGATAGQFGQLVVNGTVTLNGALNATINYAPAPSDTLVLISNDGADAVVNTFTGLVEGALVNGGPFRIAYAQSGNDVALRSTSMNLPPTVSVVANPTNVTVGQLVTFTTSVVDPESQTVTLSYAYGDGSSDASGLHTYQAAGTYTVTVTANDGFNTVTATTLVTVVPAANPPTSQFRVGVKFNLGPAGGGRDRIQVEGVVFVPSNLNFAGQVLVLNIGGNSESFTLNAKGAARNSNTSIVLKRRSGRGRAGGEAKFRATITNANYQANLKQNLPLAANGLPQAIPISVTLAGVTVRSIVTLNLRGREGRFNGSGKVPVKVSR